MLFFISLYHPFPPFRPQATICSRMVSWYIYNMVIKSGWDGVYTGIKNQTHYIYYQGFCKSARWYLLFRLPTKISGWISTIEFSFHRSPSSASKRCVGACRAATIDFFTIWDLSLPNNIRHKGRNSTPLYVPVSSSNPTLLSEPTVT